MKKGIYSPPHTYSEWTDILSMLKMQADDETVLEAMKQGTIEWQTGIAERFTKRLADAINFRMNQATDKFQKEMGHARGQERVIVQALLALRRELCFLTRVMDIPAIPEKERPRYIQLVISQANSIQNSLEDSAKSDRSGKLLNIVRNNRVNEF